MPCPRTRARKPFDYTLSASTPVLDTPCPRIKLPSPLPLARPPPRNPAHLQARECDFGGQLEEGALVSAQLRQAHWPAQLQLLRRAAAAAAADAREAHHLGGAARRRRLRLCDGVEDLLRVGGSRP